MKCPKCGKKLIEWYSEDYKSTAEARRAGEVEYECEDCGIIEPEEE